MGQQQPPDIFLSNKEYIELHTSQSLSNIRTDIGVMKNQLKALPEVRTSVDSLSKSVNRIVGGAVVAGALIAGLFAFLRYAYPDSPAPINITITDGREGLKAESSAGPASNIASD